MAKSAKKKPSKSLPKKKVLKKAAKKLVKKTTKAPVKKTSGKKKREDLNCFLTTACVSFYGLKDDGYELSTLRNYRDTYLSKNEEGKKLIQTYYKVSPPLIQLINKDVDKESCYRYIYSQIDAACTAIDKRHYVKAKTIYKKMVDTLLESYSM